MNATAELTDNDTLAEMSEAVPHVAAPQPQDPGPLTWHSSGKWGFTGSAPAELGVKEDGQATLLLRFRSHRNARRELTSLRDDLAGRCRATLLAALWQHPAYQTWAEAHAEYQLARLRVAELEKKTADLETERLRLTAKPKGSGPRLVTLNSEQEELNHSLRAARAEADALQPLADETRRAVEAVARQLGQDAARQSNADHLADIDAKLAAFGEKHAEELTEIAAMIQARKAALRQEELTAFALDLLRFPEPVVEPASV